MKTIDYNYTLSLPLNMPIYSKTHSFTMLGKTKCLNIIFKSSTYYFYDFCKLFRFSDLYNYFVGIVHNDATDLGGEGQWFCDYSLWVLLLKRVSMMGRGSKNHQHFEPALMENPFFYRRKTLFLILEDTNYCNVLLNCKHNLLNLLHTIIFVVVEPLLNELLATSNI